MEPDTADPDQECREADENAWACRTAWLLLPGGLCAEWPGVPAVDFLRP